MFGKEWQETMSVASRRRTRREKGLGNWRIMRYADDFVIMVSGTREHAEGLRGRIQAALDPLGLRLSKEKTRVVHLDEGFDFLGFRIQRRRKRGTGRYAIYTYPRKKALESVKAEIRALTRPLSIAVEAVLRRINSVVRGWCNYFRHGVSKATFSYLGHYVWYRVTRMLWRRHNRMGWKRLARKGMLVRNISAGAITLYDAAKTPVSRYRHRWHIPTPWELTPDKGIIG
jgi:RNA-directed DNA polymerase